MRNSILNRVWSFLYRIVEYLPIVLTVALLMVVVFFGPGFMKEVYQSSKSALLLFVMAAVWISIGFMLLTLVLYQLEKFVLGRDCLTNLLVDEEDADNEDPDKT